MLETLPGEQREMTGAGSVCVGAGGGRVVGRVIFVFLLLLEIATFSTSPEDWTKGD